MVIYIKAKKRRDSMSLQKDVYSIKEDFLPNAQCLCSSCNTMIKGLKNQEKQKCPHCGYEFEIDFTIRTIE